MKLKITGGRLLILLVGALTIWMLSGSSEESKIKALLKELEEAVPVVLAQPPLEQMLSVRKYAARIADPVQLEVFDASLNRTRSYSRANVEQAAQAGIRTFDTLEVRLEHLDVTVAGKTATASMELHALGSTDGRSDKFYDHWRVELELEKPEREWLVSKVKATNLRERTATSEEG